MSYEKTWQLSKTCEVFFTYRSGNPFIEIADKKKTTDSIYRMQSEKVDDFDLDLIKRIIPKDRFEQLVQDAFDRFDRFFIGHQKHFDELFEKWKAKNASQGQIALIRSRI